MARDPDHLGGLIGRIYDAAMDESLWPEVMEHLVRATHSQAAWFFVLRDPETPDFTTFSALNFDPEMMAEYVSGMARHDPILRGIAARPHQVLVHDADVITETDKQRHVYYNWHRQRSDTWHRLAGVVSPEPGVHAGITLHRTRSAGDFDLDVKRRCQLLFHHLERALMIAFRLGTLGQMGEASFLLLDQIPQGVFLFDQSGRVVRGNRAGHDLLAAQDGWVIEHGTLRLQRSHDDRKLSRLVQGIVASACGDDQGGTMAARRPSGLRSYSVRVVPLASTTTSGLSASRLVGCVLVADPERPPDVSEHLFCTLFDLTRSEALLAARLAAGDDLRTAAMALGITYATARSTLTALFRKTRTRRQPELVRLLLTASPLLLPPAVRAGLPVDPASTTRGFGAESAA